MPPERRSIRSPDQTGALPKRYSLTELLGRPQEIPSRKATAATAIIPATTVPARRDSVMVVKCNAGRNLDKTGSTAVGSSDRVALLDHPDRRN
jgi:hypothetical protein